MKVPAARDRTVEQVGHVAGVTVQQTLRLDEVEEEQAGKGGEWRRVTVEPRPGRAEPLREPIQGVPEGAKEAWRDAFTRQHFADSQRQRERRFALRGREAFERCQRGAGGTGDGNRRHAQTHGTSYTHEPERLSAQRACQAALGAGGQPARGGARGLFGSGRLEGEHSKRAVPRDERGTADSLDLA